MSGAALARLFLGAAITTFALLPRYDANLWVAPVLAQSRERVLYVSVFDTDR